MKTPPASTDYSQLGGGTNNVYSVPIHDTASAQPTFTGQTYDTLAKVLYQGVGGGGGGGVQYFVPLQLADYFTCIVNLLVKTPRGVVSPSIVHHKFTHSIFMTLDIANQVF